MKTMKFILVWCTMLLLSSTKPREYTQLEQELQELTKYGLNHRLVDANTVELYDAVRQTKRAKTLLEPSIAEIYAWANRTYIERWVEEK